MQVAADAVRAAAARHAFAGIDFDGTPAIHYTRGNPDCHVILRGGTDGTNYDVDSVAGARAVLEAAGLGERLMIDVCTTTAASGPSSSPRWRPRSAARSPPATARSSA